MLTTFFDSLKRIFKTIDCFLLALTIIATVFGVFMIYSATKSTGLTNKATIQIYAASIGIILLLIISYFDYEQLADWSVYIFGVNVFLLILVLIPGIGSGDTQWGARSWIRITQTIGFQPAEIVKIGFIITFAKHLSISKDDINRPLTVLSLLLHGGIIIGLIMLQPDAGSAMVFGFIMILMLFAAGLSYWYFLAGGAVLAVLAPLSYFFLMQPYQQNRVNAFFNPEADALGSGYNVIQSKIAVGSGKIFGKGFLQGTQNQMNFLPTKHTDFIFGIIGEELGFIGAMLVLILLIAIVLRILYVSSISKNSVGTYIATGVSAMLIFHTLENIGMCIGLMPVTGIPLPFFSYGGSAIITNMIAIGLVLSVYARRKSLNF